MRSRLKWMLLGLLVFVAGQPERCEGVLPRLRVGLLQHRSEVLFSGAAGVTVQQLAGDDVVTWAPPDEAWRAVAAGRGLQLVDPAGSETPVPSGGIRLLPPEGGTVTIYGLEGHWDQKADRQYRGTIEIRTGSGELSVVNLVDAETYLRGVVPSEMPATYPLAALQAQAVAARGQVLVKAGRHRAEGFDLCSTQHCQVYGGATSEDPRTDEAVASTWGEVLTYRGRVADTLYSSTCGGHTANNEDYWVEATPVPYLRGGPDFEPEDRVAYAFPLDEEQMRQYLKYAPAVNCNQPTYGKADKLRWWSVVSRDQLADTLQAEVGDFGALLGVRVAERARSGLVQRVDVIGSRRLVKLRGGSQIRRALGGLNSPSFAIEAYPDEKGVPAAFAIWGAGWGHQVGMCQVGAAGLADRGRGYRDILLKYYSGCQVERRY